MGTQDDMFYESEGDKWFARNRPALGSSDKVGKSPVLHMLKNSGITPSRVLEIGCSNGWMLAEIKKRYSCDCVGIEVSEEAIKEGRKAYSDVIFRRGMASSLPLGADERFDVVILSFVLHWISRETLLKVVAEADRAVTDGGYLIISDFSPDCPTKRKYHHLPKENVFTWKLDYPGIFLSTGIYSRVSSLVFDHEKMMDEMRASIPSDDRCMVTLLRKSIGEYYKES